MCRDRINCYKIPHSPARCVLDSNLLSQNINTKQTHTHARKKVRKTFTYIYLDTIRCMVGVVVGVMVSVLCINGIANRFYLRLLSMRNVRHTHTHTTNIRNIAGALDPRAPPLSQICLHYDYPVTWNINGFF